MEQTTSETARAEAPSPPAAPAPDAAGPKRVYLRTTYPLNPGIPHYVDFPVRDK